MSEFHLSAASLRALETLVNETISKGQTLDWFVRQIRDRGEPLGWHEAFEYRVPTRRYRRAQIVLMSCLRLHHKALRYHQLQNASFGFWVYRAQTDHNRYCDHTAFDRLALPPDHPFWGIWAPPNGLMCDCQVSAANSAAGIRRVGGDPDKPIPAWWDNPDHGPDPDYRGFARPAFERIVERALQDTGE